MLIPTLLNGVPVFLTAPVGFVVVMETFVETAVLVVTGRVEVVEIVKDLGGISDALDDANVPVFVLEKRAELAVFVSKLLLIGLGGKLVVFCVVDDVLPTKLVVLITELVGLDCKLVVFCIVDVVLLVELDLLITVLVRLVSKLVVFCVVDAVLPAELIV